MRFMSRQDKANCKLSYCRIKNVMFQLGCPFKVGLNFVLSEAERQNPGPPYPWESSKGHTLSLTPVRVTCSLGAVQGSAILTCLAILPQCSIFLLVLCLESRHNSSPLTSFFTVCFPPSSCAITSNLKNSFLHVLCPPTFSFPSFPHHEEEWKMNYEMSHLFTWSPCTCQIKWEM